MAASLSRSSSDGDFLSTTAYLPSTTSNPPRTHPLPSIPPPTMPSEPTGNPNSHDPSKFSTHLTGTCLCGSITVTITDSELFTKKRGHLCHCANCRKVAGSYVASNLMIEEEKVKIEDRDGTLKTYEDKATLSGGSVFRSFCSTDGNPIRSVTKLYPARGGRIWTPQA
ncbi:unnamed protein product [Zymoseptoria tritici ST99CH_3D7]|uniref:CENP-V/GFA domain-containing protein n=1 Tax=Zymoseptoria tritici (strain ST99CH_3D7) TaxID=1276538 RepID=A0A1X7RSP1_ZYMT9|nr:unnamed protein product [Zymoseptoria tritici ST99CH_3D7]